MRAPDLNAAMLLQEAVACHQAGRLDAARKGYERLLQKDPRDPNALNLLGVLLVTQGHVAKGIQLIRRAVGIYPPFPDALSNLGKALLESGQPEAAQAACEKALTYAPTDPEILNNHGNALTAIGRPQEALDNYRRAHASRPDYPEALTNEGMSLLALGDHQNGWPRYEHRWRLPKLAPTLRGLAMPRWTGTTSLDGKRLLLHAEQGLGDTLQFCRYAPLAAARGAHVVLEVPPPLTRLAATLDGVAEIVAQGVPRPPVDLHCPLMSLPAAFGTTLDTIPATVPYLHADPARIAAWRTRLAGQPGRRIGLVWAGNPRREDREANAVDQRRSMKLAQFTGLGNATFVSLQKGDAAREARSPPAGPRLLDWTRELTDFADTAALVAALDLVIGVDTSVVHLAGAIGTPVWVLNRYDSCWRWMRDRSDSPWYPTMRLFTQPRPGDWDSVLAAVRTALADSLPHPSLGPQSGPRLG
ncbi:MAG: tetratricopeptide repeat-containing glycosyltransferase family protein [Acetobacteraceae bacterium]|nr:tetratricopeptide repeat-containing glycosyltransferase family protein [Acetobacteraceae bacterium]